MAGRLYKQEVPTQQVPSTYLYVFKTHVNLFKKIQENVFTFYAQLALGVVVLTTFLPSVILSYNCEFSPSHLEYHNVTNLKQSLQHQILGPVLAPWDDKYEQFRSIHNQACCQKPLLIARPRSQKVSKCPKNLKNISVCPSNFHTSLPEMLMHLKIFLYGIYIHYLLHINIFSNILHIQHALSHIRRYMKSIICEIEINVIKYTDDI